MKQPRKSQAERNENLFREGWKLELAASLFTNDDKTEIVVVFSDGRYFRGALVDESK